MQLCLEDEMLMTLFGDGYVGVCEKRSGNGEKEGERNK